MVKRNAPTSASVLMAPNGVQIKKPKKTNEGPQRPPTALMLYSKASRAMHEAAHSKITQPQLNIEWNELTAAKRAPFIKEATQTLKVYRKEKAAFEEARKYPCGGCGENVNEDDEAILCEYGCSLWFHLSCTALTTEAYDLLADFEEGVWMCRDCFNKNIQPKEKPKPRLPVASAADAPTETQPKADVGNDPDLTDDETSLVSKGIEVQTSAPVIESGDTDSSEQEVNGIGSSTNISQDATTNAPEPTPRISQTEYSTGAQQNGTEDLHSNTTAPPADHTVPSNAHVSQPTQQPESNTREQHSIAQTAPLETMQANTTETNSSGLAHFASKEPAQSTNATQEDVPTQTAASILPESNSSPITTPQLLTTNTNENKSATVSESESATAAVPTKASTQPTALQLPNSTQIDPMEIDVVGASGTIGDSSSQQPAQSEISHLTEASHVIPDSVQDGQQSLGAEPPRSPQQIQPTVQATTSTVVHTIAPIVETALQSVVTDSAHQPAVISGAPIQPSDVIEVVPITLPSEVESAGAANTVTTNTSGQVDL